MRKHFIIYSLYEIIQIEKLLFYFNFNHHISMYKAFYNKIKTITIANIIQQMANALISHICFIHPMNVSKWPCVSQRNYGHPPGHHVCPNSVPFLVRQMHRLF